MLIEAELKAIVRDVDAVRAALDERAPAEVSTYADVTSTIPTTGWLHRDESCACVRSRTTTAKHGCC